MDLVLPRVALTTPSLPFSVCLFNPLISRVSLFSPNSPHFFPNENLPVYKGCPNECDRCHFTDQWRYLSQFFQSTHLP